MEMVKVDIQKLQLLNDRIAQTLEALDQVRLSAHGIQHSPAAWGAYGYPVMPQVMPQAFSPSPYSSFGSPFSPFPGAFANPYSPYAGIQHSSFAPQFGSYGSYGAYASRPFTSYTNGASPYVSWVNPGLSHTTAFEPAWQQLWRTQTMTPTIAGYPVPLS